MSSKYPNPPFSDLKPASVNVLTRKSSSPTLKSNVLAMIMLMNRLLLVTISNSCWMFEIMLARRFKYTDSLTLAKSSIISSVVSKCFKVPS